VITTSEGQFFPDPGTDETLPRSCMGCSCRCRVRCAQGVGSRRVDKRVRKRHVGIDPCAEFLVQGAGESNEGSTRHFAVVEQDVTRHHGETVWSRLNVAVPAPR
jgi:hypothetical protein